MFASHLTDDDDRHFPPLILNSILYNSSHENSKSAHPLVPRPTKRIRNLNYKIKSLTTSIICIKVNPKLSCSGSDSLTTGLSSVLYESSKSCSRRFSWYPAKQSVIGRDK